MKKENIKQVIIPKDFLDDKELTDHLTEQLGIVNPLTYRTCRGNPNEFFGSIRDKYLDFIETEL